jgi:hypothetical protein
MLSPYTSYIYSHKNNKFYMKKEKILLERYPTFPS